MVWYSFILAGSGNSVSANDFINKQKMDKSLFARGQQYLRNVKVLNTTIHFWWKEIVIVLLFCIWIATSFVFNSARSYSTLNNNSTSFLTSVWFHMSTESPHGNPRELPSRFCHRNFKADSSNLWFSEQPKLNAHRTGFIWKILTSTI